MIGLALTFLLFPSCEQENGSSGWIRIDGNHFVDDSGTTVVFQGVNIRDPHNLEEEGHWTKSHFQEAKTWGANVIRLPIHPPSWRARGEEGYLALIDQAVEWARELELYLILDWHSIGNLKMEMFQHEMYITSVKETSAFWNSVSSRYANEPVVLMYELYNEPTISGDNFGDMSWEEWKAINEDLIAVIRKNHPRSLIGVAGFNWAYDLTPVRDAPIDASGIAYISHPYPQKREAPWEAQWEADWGYVADNYPVFLTEIGYAVPGEEGLHIPVEGDEVYGNALVNYTSARGISWVVWCFDPDWPPYLFTDWEYTPPRQGAYLIKVLSGD
jgi:aryl-phospho-beta-D-glucosidase BglC (GH1 family)